MSNAFGTGLRMSPRWRIYDKASRVVGPAKTLLFMDEHPDSLNDDTCCLYPDGANTLPQYAQICDIPGSFHGGACSTSFCDGHAELHKWKGTRIKAPITGEQIPIDARPSPANDSWLDVKWLAEHATVRAQ